MGLRFYKCGVTVLFVLVGISTETSGSGSGKECNFFGGSWVEDNAYPLYDAVSSCPFIEREFSCQKNGRPDSLYTNYKWKPLNCDLHRFDGKAFLEKFRGKSILFVGDSLSRNQWQSLTCMLHSSLPVSNYNITREGDVSTLTFTDYGVDVKLDRNVFLVDVVRENAGRVLKLDSIKGGKLWKGNHVLVFNTWHWWNRRGPSQPWDYIQIGDKLVRDMERLAAFEKALLTWAGWVEINVNPSDTLVFFQGISPSHYNALYGMNRKQRIVSDKNNRSREQPIQEGCHQR